MNKSKPKIEVKDVVLESGIKVKPVYTKEDAKDIDYESEIQNPGEYPFTRGIHSFMY
ncbi:MAG: methylmalonyl-CoA mutase, partial [Thermoplasmata archaeon]